MLFTNVVFLESLYSHLVMLLILQVFLVGLVQICMAGRPM